VGSKVTFEHHKTVDIEAMNNQSRVQKGVALARLGAVVVKRIGRRDTVHSEVGWELGPVVCGSDLEAGHEAGFGPESGPGPEVDRVAHTALKTAHMDALEHIVILLLSLDTRRLRTTAMIKVSTKGIEPRLEYFEACAWFRPIDGLEVRVVSLSLLSAKFQVEHHCFESQKGLRRAT